MATVKQMQISKPCHESWAKMTPTEQGRFCKSCQKCVIDFTSMSHDEIATFLQQNPQDVCGRIGKTQLKDFNRSLQTPSSKWRKWKLAAATLTGLTLAIPAMGQNAHDVSSKTEDKIEWNGYFHAPEKVEQADIEVEEKQSRENREVEVIKNEEGIIRGHVFEAENSEPLAGATVYLAGTHNGTVTNTDGFFELEIDETHHVKTMEVNVSYIGYETYSFSITPASYQEESKRIHLQESAILLGGCGVFVKRRNFFGRTWQGIKNIFRKKY